MPPVRLLIVEDVEADTILLLSELSRAYEVTYRRVDNLAALSTALQTETWDILLSDYSLPQFSALKVLDVLRSTPIDLPCIVLSGTVDEESASQALRSGARDFISKNRLTRLVPAVARELHEKEERRRKRAAEEALDEARRRMRFALETAGVGTWEVDLPSQRSVWSPEMEQLHGLAINTFGGTADAFFDLVHPDDRQRVRDCVGGARHDRPAFRLSYRCTGPRCEGRWIDLIGRLVYDADDRPIGAAGVALDITEQKALEDQFRHAQRMDSIGRLAGGIAHDFNNLLTAILGFSSLLIEDEAVTAAPPQVKADLEQIRLAGQRAAALTNQLLAFSRKQILQPTVLSINPIVASLEPMLQRLIGADILLTTRLAPDLGATFSDVGQIEQVIMNLTINARDAMPNGGSIIIETANVDLDEGHAGWDAALTPGAYVMLAVTDTGTGITPDVQARMFEPFFTTKPAGQGTGLGLATVFGIVQQHDGHVRVSSEPGHGTTFRIYVPRVAEHAVQRAAPQAVDTTSRGETVLLVDDDSAIRYLARQILTAAHYHVLEAANADAATVIAASHEGEIHLLITDVVMPGVSGRSLAYRLTSSRPLMKVLFMSGYSDGSVLQHGILSRGVAFLQKPFTPVGFTQAVRQVLDSGELDSLESAR